MLYSTVGICCQIDLTNGGFYLPYLVVEWSIFGWQFTFVCFSVLCGNLFLFCRKARVLGLHKCDHCLRFLTIFSGGVVYSCLQVKARFPVLLRYASVSVAIKKRHSRL